MAIADGVGITGVPWMDAGFELLQETGPLDRDNPLSVGTAGCGRRLATYAEAAAMSRLVMTDLDVPVFTDGVWRGGLEKLFSSELINFWQEHGPRSVLPSLATGIEAPKEVQDSLGRWSPSWSDGYVRTYRSAVCKIQFKITKTVRD